MPDLGSKSLGNNELGWLRQGPGAHGDQPLHPDVIAEIRGETAERLARLRKHLAYAEEFLEIVEGL